MGREIRMVVPNWEHPRYTEDDARDPRAVGKYRSLYDNSYEEARAEWLEGLAVWKPEEHDGDDYWEYNGNPPQRDMYRPHWPEGAATWFQVYETVSEGSPITPPFATKGELVDWLCTNKDFWNKGPLTRAQAEAFVGDGWAPSFMVINEPGNFKMAEGMEIPAALNR